MLLRILCYISLIGLLSCQGNLPEEKDLPSYDPIFAPISGHLLYLNPSDSYHAGDTIAILDTTSLQLEKQRIRTMIRAWTGKRIGAAGFTESIRLALGHRFYLQSEIKRRQDAGEKVSMLELAVNDYEIMYYQEKMRRALEEVEQENNFIDAQIEQLEIQLKQIECDVESCFLTALKKSKRIGSGPVEGRWYTQGALLMELDY